MAITTGGLTATMQTYYSKLFLERSKETVKYDLYAQFRGIPSNGGKAVNFTRHVLPAAATTGLTESVAPTGINASGVTVSATLVEYGAYTQISSLYSRTSIDTGLEEQVDLYGQHAGESIDTIIRNELTTAGAVTGQFVSGSATTTSSSNLAATDVLNSAQVRRAVRTLKKNNAPKIKGAQGNMVYGGLIAPEVVYDLAGDTTWVALQQYSLPKGLTYGIIGTYQGVEWVESTNLYVTVPTSAALYTTWVFGKESLGVVALDSKDGNGKANTKLYIKETNDNDTSQPIPMYSTIGWKAEFVPKVLNCDWIVEIYTGATG